MKPLIKWAGGKRRLLPQILPLIPKFDTYFEPFFGGGALFAALNPEKAFLTDTNRELMNMYIVVRETPLALIEHLSQHPMTKEHFEAVRAWDRGADIETKFSAISRASRFLYLNRACFNGLWRVNSRGEFNTSYGKNDMRSPCDSEEILQWSELLKGHRDIAPLGFDSALDVAGEGDFVYLDPPYLGTYSQYTSECFGFEDHIYLKKYLDRITKKGVKFLLSNSDNQAVHDVYGDYTIDVVKTRHIVGASAASRPVKTELLIRNYGV